ncbi:MAG: DUF4910 domain-containing protein [Bacteroidales bacterium]|nr:DUF4910 domain-containing protein [Bacteroidales bacterium]
MKEQLEKYFDRLWPLNRSLTGNGNRETLRILSEIVDLNITEVPSGTNCFDWVVPPEWNVKEAWIKDSNGNVIIDFSNNNLHLLGYSIHVKGKMFLSELRSHIYTLPLQPDIIPYLTSYYDENWGFCMSHNQFLTLKENEEYDILIDSTLNHKGSMTIGEAILKGCSDNEVLFSTYICHPSMANNELSGLLVSAFIFRELKNIRNRFYTYRFVYLPETIGSIYYLSRFGEHLKQTLDAGYVVTCVGDQGDFSYKRSRRGNSLADRAAELILRQSGTKFNIENFFPTGSDERQYCSPGFNLPVGSLMRTRYGKYPEYHTSADDKNFISFDALEKSVLKYLEIINLLENNFVYINTKPFCEPQLGKRGLYPAIGDQKNKTKTIVTTLWILNLADGTNDLISISEKSNIPVPELIPVVERLLENGILTR